MIITLSFHALALEGMNPTGFVMVLPSADTVTILSGFLLSSTTVPPAAHLAGTWQYAPQNQDLRDILPNQPF